MPTLEVKGQLFSIDTATADEIVQDGRARVEIDVRATLNDAPPLYGALVHSHLTRERLSLAISGPGKRRIQASPLIVQALAPATNFNMPPSDGGGFNWIVVRFCSPE